MEVISIKEFIKKSKTSTILDVRSPGEYSKGHIPSAVSLPLFTDKERAEVGTIYKRRGKDSAVERGLEIVGPKLAMFVKEAKKYDGELLVHCWRGGMRSKSLAWLLETSGRKVSVLNGGYKIYRTEARKRSAELKIVILGGSTGSGKTDVLTELDKLGEQVIDLEAKANHKGSSFGALGQNPQPTNEQFENMIFEKILNLDISKRVWIESESKAIGSVHIPDELFLNMRTSPLVKLDVPKSERVKRLVREYGNFPKDKLEEGVLKISKRLGGLNTNKSIEAIGNNNFEVVADLTLSYYDKTYEFCYNNRDTEIIEFKTEEDNPSDTAARINRDINIYR